ncbi:MAG: F0F1 ATP synthase subunit A, partial [Solirubrobacteraceae bacterium]
MTKLQGMSKRRKLGLSVAFVYVLGIVVFAVAFGVKRHNNTTFKPTNEFKLTNWVHLIGPLNINKGVLYLFIAGALTIGIMLWVARHMEGPPNRVRTAVEWLYSLSQSMTKDNMDPKMAKKWFPLICTLFAFILASNLIGYLPLPVNSEESFKLFGLKIPSFQIYAAVTNVGLPLVLALGVFIAYNVEGVRAHGPWGYLKSLNPPGVGGKMVLFIFPLEI